MKKPKRKSAYHKPVMVSEVLEAFETEEYAHLNNLALVDATVGLGGHAKEFVKKGIFVIGIDADTSTLKIAEGVLSEACRARMPSRLEACPTPLDKYPISRGCFKLLHGNFSKIDKLVADVYPNFVQGILFDLGVSSYQLDNSLRGLSFKERGAPLDMRLDASQGVCASDLLVVLDKKRLAQVFAQVLPRNLSMKIAKAIVQQREIEPIKTVGELLDVIKPLIRRKGKVDSATLPFLALRMAVNSEIENLKSGLAGALKILAPKGRLVVISFHSGEDRIVKNYFREIEELKKGSIISKKPIIPDEGEIKENPRARSAKLRVLEKL